MAYEAHLRDVAQRLTELTGEDWKPAEVQAAIWGHYQPLMALVKHKNFSLDDLLSGKVDYSQAEVERMRAQSAVPALIQHEKIATKLQRVKDQYAQSNPPEPYAPRGTSPKGRTLGGIPKEPFRRGNAGYLPPPNQPF